MYVNLPPSKAYRNYIIIAVIVILIIIATIGYLAWKVHQLKKSKNGKKK